MLLICDIFNAAHHNDELIRASEQPFRVAMDKEQCREFTSVKGGISLPTLEVRMAKEAFSMHKYKQDIMISV